MRAVVLVGGFGTRLRPLTYTTPKSLLPVGHRTILEHVLHNLAAGGVTDAVLSLGFKPHGFLSAYPDGTCAGVRLHYAVESEPLDTAGAIRFAATTAGFTDETFLALNGDVLTDLDVGGLVAFHRQRHAEGTLHLIRVEEPSAFGVVPIDGDGRVEAFIEKPPRDTAPTNLINAGTYVLEPSVLARIPGDRPVSIERETFPAMVADRSLYGHPTADYWLDAGRPDQYLQANLDLLDGIRRSAPIDPIGPGATVAAGATVVASVVGGHCRVAGAAIIERSVLLPGSSVGVGAVVTGSILGRHVVVGPGARLTDVVIGDGEEIPAGSVLDRVRVPEPQ
jgi:mannose-1-phosphate guanylyltransferase